MFSLGDNFGLLATHHRSIDEEQVILGSGTEKTRINGTNILINLSKTNYYQKINNPHIKI